MTEEIILREIQEELRSYFADKLVKIILFGSFARGKEDDDSDVDILLVINDNYLQTHDKFLSDLTIKLLTTTNRLFSFYTESEKFFDEHRYKMPFLKNVVEEGKVIYG